MDGGVYENDEISIKEAAEELLEDEGWTGERIRGDYDQLMEKVEEMDEVVMAEIQNSQGEYKPLAKVEELEEVNYNMIDNVLNNMPPKKEPYLEYFAAECDEFHDMGAYEKSTDVNQIAAVYEKYRENPETAYLGCSMGIIYRDPEDSYYDEAEFAIVKGNTVFGNLMDDVRFYEELALVREGIEKIHEALPDYKYVPMRDVREAMYPEKMTTEQLAEALDEIAEAFDPYEYRDNVEPGENTVQEVMLDLQSGNTHSYISYLKDIVDEECDLSVRAGVLMERLKAYKPELPKDMEPMVYVNYCEKSELGSPRCQKLSDALCLAAKRGVDVRIITPGIPDKKFIYNITRSFYHGLVKHGVRVYEWTPGFCHAKMSVADDCMATCGTINLDYRSLYHHFENGCFMADCQAVVEIKNDLIRTMGECRDVTDQYQTGRSAYLRLGQLFMRLFAGLL